ncbi:DUF2007 domain-containing protein [Bacteroides sp. UBA939]|uniref:putative signal transducing protein n=1 Tax=Bacteroides sp. UBA939 TaxID=1946092 RepID=UPI0025BBB139|nr:DUF2007 domain-containing protein [Bacteroides sp. UBA939]
MENEKFITVLTATFGYEVAVIRGRLESEGITCFVQDELTVQVSPFYSNAIGGVKLQVRENDLEQAVEILEEAGYIKDGDSEVSDKLFPLNGYPHEQENANNKAEAVCPYCGSREVAPVKKAGWLFLLTSLLCACPTPFIQKKHYCFNCKQEFKNKHKL